jgi:hypothetical protein
MLTAPVQPLPRLSKWLRGLPPDELDVLAKRFAERALALGLAVTLPDGSQKAIPPILSAVGVDEHWLDAQRRRVDALTRATYQVAKSMLNGKERAEILDALAPFERTCIEAVGLPDMLATVRADLFLDDDGGHALELNATIPAMQGYSDIAVRALLEALAPSLDYDQAQVEAWIGEAGENAMSLLDALKKSHALQAKKPLQSIALVHRTQDSQLSELNYLARRWVAAGVDAYVVEADKLQITPEGAVVPGVGRVDFIYRHIFARRIDPQWPLGQLLSHPPSLSITNRVAAPLEMKRVLAEISRVMSSPWDGPRPPHGLDPDDLLEMRGTLGVAMAYNPPPWEKPSPPWVQRFPDFIPWTRALRAEPSTLPHGEHVKGVHVDDLVKHVAENPAEFVIKRSWDYGGKAVFLGFEAELPVTRERAQAAYGEALHWPELVRRAAADPNGGGFVVQARVHAAPVERLVVTDTGARWESFFGDFSLYGSYGIGEVKWHGVCRASKSAVVNIAGGGGVVPVLPGPVARALDARVPRW